MIKKERKNQYLELENGLFCTYVPHFTRTLWLAPTHHSTAGASWLREVWTGRRAGDRSSTKSASPTPALLGTSPTLPGTGSRLIFPPLLLALTSASSHVSEDGNTRDSAGAKAMVSCHLPSYFPDCLLIFLTRN